MSVSIPVSSLAVLLSLAFAGSLSAQTPEQPRTRPVLRSGGTYSTNQSDSQKAASNESNEIDTGDVVRVSTNLIEHRFKANPAEAPLGLPSLLPSAVS